MAGLKIKRGDTVKVITGSHKGETGKVVRVDVAKKAVYVEGLHIVKRHVKPSMVSPQGGITELHKPIDVSKVALVTSDKGSKTTRVGYVVAKDGSKKRVMKQANNKEIA